MHVCDLQREIGNNKLSACNHSSSLLTQQQQQQQQWQKYWQNKKELVPPKIYLQKYGQRNAEMNDSNSERKREGEKKINANTY